MLQEEDGLDVGWLCYSTNTMDDGALADKLSEITGINVGLWWKNINSGGKITNQTSQVKVLIVKVSAKKKWQVQNALTKLYSRTIKENKEHPNNIRLRYVKPHKRWNQQGRKKQNGQDAPTVKRVSCVYQKPNNSGLLSVRLFTTTRYNSYILSDNYGSQVQGE